MADRCICFTTNENYLFPTAVSAIQAREHSSVELADVAIYCVGAESRESEKFARVFEAEDIEFTCVPPKAIDGAHVAFTRLFLDSLVPRKYTELLYIDGDTQIRGSLDSLLKKDVPVGKFMAATDPIAFKYTNTSAAPQKFQDYCKRLGVVSIKDYFNSGVLRMKREGWGGVGQQAYEFCRDSGKHDLHFFDQDGLNAVAARTGARLPMSLKYNFPIFLRNCRVERELQPLIYHFMSAPKPWNGNFPPWDEVATVAYRDIRLKYPSLADYHGRLTLAKQARYLVQQRVKQLHEAISWGFSQRRVDILSHERLVASAR